MKEHDMKQNGPPWIYLVRCTYGNTRNPATVDGLYTYASCRKREDAEALKALALSKGYRDAHIKAIREDKLATLFRPTDESRGRGRRKEFLTT